MMSTLLGLIDELIIFVSEYESDEEKEGGMDALILDVVLSSFGYKYGALQGTDLNINVRSVANPSVKLRKNQTGLHRRFRKEFFKMKDVSNFYDKVYTQILRLLGQMIEKKESNAYIGIGCEFGKHRSVSFVEKLKEDMNKNEVDDHRILVQTKHRDIQKNEQKRKGHRR